MTSNEKQVLYAQPVLLYMGRGVVYLTLFHMKNSMTLALTLSRTRTKYDC
jgi:hypothetical protein